MTEVRRRKGGRHKSSYQRNGITKPGVSQKEPVTILGMGIQQFVLLVSGVLLCLYVGYKHAWYMGQIHENDLWFTNIKEVEREISFRTESGLYYSYYKQMVQAPSITQGLYGLTHDNLTEHPSTINVLERMNIYQEVILSILYRILPFKSTMEPIFFYINSVFALHGMLVCSLFAITWMLSGSWLAGGLTGAFYIFNRSTSTENTNHTRKKKKNDLHTPRFAWAKLKGVPQGVLWPVRLISQGEVFIHSDNAIVTVEMKNCICNFPGNIQAIEAEAIENGYTRSYDSLKKTCEECDLVAPGRITSVSMRKYTATLTQMLNLNSYQLEWMCRHLGHTTDVHKTFYRHMSGYVERVQLSKLFLLQDLNLTAKFKGKSLDEIDITELIFPQTEESVTGSVDEDTLVNPSDRNEATCDFDEVVFEAADSEKEQSEDNAEVLSVEKTKELKPKTQKLKRQTWTSVETKEIEEYFKSYLDSKICPRKTALVAAKLQSKKRGGIPNHEGEARVNLSIVTILGSTFLFSLFWQFNQFILLLQAFALFGVWILDMVPAHKVRFVLLSQAVSLVLVCLLQFVNKMILGSLVISFIVATFLLMYFRGDILTPCSIPSRIFKVAFYSIAVLVLMVLLNIGAKTALQLEADEHIYKFLLNKFGIGNPRDFDSRLYLCIDAFGFLQLDTYERMSKLVVFPIYFVVHLTLLVLLFIAVMQNWSNHSHEMGLKDHPVSKNSHLLSSRPDVAFHAVQVVFFGALAMSTLRMKYLWTPYMCVLAGFGVADYKAWKSVLTKLRANQDIVVQIARHFATISVLALLLAIALPPALKDLEDLKEFWDPDTVELMEWIKKNTAPAAALSGSMQLMAGVKLCTGRPITNHPHYEDKHLRIKTKELYQYYGKRSPEDVHALLTGYKTDYIILEDSICLAPSKGGCRLPDLLDIDFGVIPDSGKTEPGLVKSQIPRFCDEVRKQTAQYTKYFKHVFTNKTFRIYKVLQL